MGEYRVSRQTFNPQRRGILFSVHSIGYYSPMGVSGVATPDINPQRRRVRREDADQVSASLQVLRPETA